MGGTIAEVLAAVARAERSGDFLTAYDLATRGIEDYPGAPPGDALALRHRAVLALARSGATRRARTLLAAYGLADHADAEIAALEARLAKDEALAAGAAERPRLARAAAERYAAIHARAGGHYLAINAATMFLIAGDRARADELARCALAAATAVASGAGPGQGSAGPSHRGDGLAVAAGDGLTAYWALGTAAEARLLLGELDAARDAIARAREVNPGDHAALASTRRQLGLLARVLEVPADVLRPLEPPAVIHYTGHRIGARFPAGREREVAAGIAAALAERGVGTGVGALASGADILVAEALLARGAELHVILPCGDAEFVRRSVDAPGWAERFAACRAAAASVTYATADAVAIDDELFRHASRLAMGTALVRARQLYAPVAQLAVWDGTPTDRRAGTAADVATWRARGLASIVIEPRGDATAPAPTAPPVDAVSPRRVRALLFGDIKGYSRIAEDRVPAFVTSVLGAFGRALDACDGVEERNTWGDGLYVVVRDAAAAARCALALQDAMAGVDLVGAGLPPHLGLRLAGHVGPVYALVDAVAGRASHFGTHVTRTARIEPVTPEGEVFVTEAFAAELALDDPGFACEYVGHIPVAKGFGAMRMLSLRRAPQGAP